MITSSTPIPGNVVVTHEFTLRGAFRFDTEFADATSLLDQGLDVDAWSRTSSL